MWRSDDEVKEVLDATTCALCPNTIGDQSFLLITDPDIINELSRRGDGSVLREPRSGLHFMLVHRRCMEAATLIAGGDV